MQDSFAFLYLCTKQRIVVFHNMRPLKQLKKKNLEKVIIDNKTIISKYHEWQRRGIISLSHQWLWHLSFVINSLSNFAAIYVYENNDSQSSGNSGSKKHMQAINKTTQNRFSVTVTLQSWVDYYDVGGCRANGKHVSASLSVDVAAAISTPVTCLCLEQRSKSAVNETQVIKDCLPRRGAIVCPDGGLTSPKIVACYTRDATTFHR